MKTTAPGWLTESELTELTGLPPALIQRGLAAGLFDGLVETLDGERRYAPDAAGLVAWSDRLGDDVVAGYITLDEAHRLFWQRARQLRRRLALAG